MVIECKWSAESFDPRNLLAFRRRYPAGENCVAARDVDRAYVRRFSGHAVKFLPLPSLLKKL